MKDSDQQYVALDGGRKQKADVESMANHMQSNTRRKTEVRVPTAVSTYS